MLSLRNQKNAAILIILYTMFSVLQCDGKPIGKRTVSEHQEMHDRSRFLQEMRRQKWLEEVMKDMHTAGGTTSRSIDARDLLRWKESAHFPELFGTPHTQEESSIPQLGSRPRNSIGASLREREQIASS
uniref:Parathyroid hormone n=1 Tax=Callorhinchus milii TaxID=7868 RepID=D8X183_CALMI|nr:parathyroid hormone 1 [Callorhinchus milii]